MEPWVPDLLYCYWSYTALTPPSPVTTHTQTQNTSHPLPHRTLPRLFKNTREEGLPAWESDELRATAERECWMPLTEINFPPPWNKNTAVGWPLNRIIMEVEPDTVTFSGFLNHSSSGFHGTQWNFHLFPLGQIQSHLQCSVSCTDVTFTTQFSNGKQCYSQGITIRFRSIFEAYTIHIGAFHMIQCKI